jgi:hypothetical protein
MKRLVSILLALAVCAALVAGAAASPDALTLVSGAGSDMVAVSSDGTNYGTPAQAVLTWKHGAWPLITDSDAAWISSADYVEDPVNDSWRKFTRTFELCPGAYNISGSIQVTSDNAEEVWLNGYLVGTDGEVYGDFVDDHEWATVLTYDLTSHLQAGTNTLVTVVRNYYQSGGSVTGNPTGLIYEAVITYDCPIQVTIDIKPGSYPNCFNMNGNGVVPVAILGSADFDVTQIDVSTLKFGGLDVRVKGNGTPQCSVEDVSGDFTYPEGAPDGFDDLVCQFVDDPATWSPDDGTATLSGNLKADYGSTPFEGSDEICLRPE